MGDYKISLSFKNEDVEKLNDKHFKLCFAAGVAENPNYNVVAWTDKVATSVEITWRDQYQIAATKDTFSEGVKFSIKTTKTDINFQDVYTLPSSWTDGKITKDSSLKKTSFKFINTTDGEASAVVYKIVNGKSVPFYISADPVFSSGGQEVMTPKLKGAIWIEKNAETGTMITRNSSSVTEFDMTSTNEGSAKWDGGKFVKN